MAVALLLATPAAAQTPWPSFRYQRGASLDPGQTPTATLEHLLRGVPMLSDAQRDTVEVLEQELRDTIAYHGSRIARARRSATSPWLAHDMLHERELNVILATRQASIERMRSVLTSEQTTQFDMNTRHFRAWDIWFWNAFAYRGILLNDFDPTWEFP